MPAHVTIPPHLLPADGRFGAGPSKVRPDQLDAVARAGAELLGTSHRQAPVRDLVGSVREGLARFLDLPEGYEMLLGLGGATAFWDAAAFGLVERRAQHLVFGEFGAKFARATDQAPFLESSSVLESAPGTRPEPRAEDDVDVFAWPQNETSTGVSAPVRRPAGIDPDALVLVDATSAAGGTAVELAGTDVYYFSPQKNLGSEGGLWLGAFSPAAVERIERIGASGRWIPEFLRLSTALESSRKNQTYNTPALATLVLLDEQVRWLNDHGGMAWAAARTKESSDLVYAWAEASSFAAPFVTRPEDRSPVITTVDLDGTVDAAAVAAALRAHGVVDVEPYRRLGRNQLRIATFVSIEPADVSRLLDCVDHVVDQLVRPDAGH